MPQRFLRPGLRDSIRFNHCSMKAQNLWMRLLTLVDDFGRYDGRPSVICAHCFAVWNEQNPQDVVNPQETAALCQQLSDNNLVEFHEFEGKKVLQVTQWQERARSESKWKLPNDSKPLRNPAESCGILPPSPSPSPSPSALGATPQTPSTTMRRGKQKPTIESLLTIPIPPSLQSAAFSEVWRRWIPYRLKIKSADYPNLFAEQLLQLSEWGSAEAVESIKKALRSGHVGLFKPSGFSTARPSSAPASVEETDFKAIREAQFAERIAGQSGGGQ